MNTDEIKEIGPCPLKKDNDPRFDGTFCDSEVSESESESILKKKAKNIKKSKNKRFEKPNIIINVSDTQYDVVKFVAKNILKWQLQYEPDAVGWDLFWTDNAVQPETVGKMQAHQKINHWPGMFSLARKNHLGRNLMKMRKQFPEEYNFFPPTWLLPAEFGEFRQQFVKGKVKTFIVKPEASCQGRGIFLTRSLDDFTVGDRYVVQRYLHKPFVLDGFKFDLRIYVLLAGSDPMRIYIYREGLARFATEKYVAPNRDNLDDICMHLTNYAVNKDNPNFIFNNNADRMDIGHKRSLSAVFQQMKKMGIDTDTLWELIKSMIVKTFISAQPIIAHHIKSCQPENHFNNTCFEILGFDILLDHKLKPYVLEVNHTPSFTTDTPLDSMIKKCLIRDTLLLMNINIKTKQEVIKQKMEIQQLRQLTGKKIKLSQEERKELQEKAQKERNQHEHANLGLYEIVYPLQDSNKYDPLLLYSSKMYEELTGANIRRNIKKEDDDKPKQFFKENKDREKELKDSKLKIKDIYKLVDKIKLDANKQPSKPKLPILSKKERKPSNEDILAEDQTVTNNLSSKLSPLMHRKPMSVKSRGNTPSYSKFPEENPYTQANKVIKKELDKDKKVKKIVISQQLQGQPSGNFLIPKVFDLGVLTDEKQYIARQKTIKRNI